MSILNSVKNSSEDVKDIGDAISESLKDPVGQIVYGDEWESGATYIKFKIGEIECKAKSGQTWADWITSSFNIIGASIDGDNISINNKQVANSRDEYVDKSSEINSGENYKLLSGSEGVS